MLTRVDWDLFIFLFFHNFYRKTRDVGNSNLRTEWMQGRWRESKLCSLKEYQLSNFLSAESSIHASFNIYISNNAQLCPFAIWGVVMLVEAPQNLFWFFSADFAVAKTQIIAANCSIQMAHGFIYHTTPVNQIPPFFFLRNSYRKKSIPLVRKKGNMVNWEISVIFCLLET